MSTQSVSAADRLTDRSGSRTRFSILRTIAIVAIALYCACLAGFYYAMRQPPATFGNVMKHTGPVPFLLFPFETMWKSARAGHVSVGDNAPNFTLPLLDHSASVTLSSFRGTRPVVLVFGSYT
jgi:hypothetical protein